MSADSLERWLPDAVYAFADGSEQAWELARKCGADFGDCGVHAFPDGETLVTIKPPVVDAGHVVALYRSLHDPNAKLIEVMLAARALRSAGARKLILIAPYLPYMRQDKAFNPGESISQVAIGDFLAALFDGLVTIQPHMHRTKSLSAVFGAKAAKDLSAGGAIATHLRASTTEAGIIVGPDEESESLIREVADALGAPWLVGRKVRRGDADVAIELPDDADIKGRPATIVDDIISSGGTIATLAKALKAAGAGAITVYAVHALFNDRAMRLMADAGVSDVRSFNTVPHKTSVIDAIDVIAKAVGARE